jgi:hypothetical protein
MEGKIIFEEKEKVQELNVELNTQNTGTASFITEKINGMLDSVIIDSDQPVNIQISFADINVVLFDSSGKQLMGCNYLPLRVAPIDDKWQYFTQSFVNWILNDRVRIEVTGPYNSRVLIKFRYC